MWTSQKQQHLLLADEVAGSAVSCSSLVNHARAALRNVPPPLAGLPMDVDNRL
jgi:hypothetical protein